MNTAPAASLIAAVLLVACGNSDRTFTIEEVRADRAPEIPSGVGRSDIQRLGLQQRGAGGLPPGHPPGAQGAGSGQSRGPTFTCDLPEGWKKLKIFELERASAVKRRSHYAG